ncbi:MAG: restriction endonuclease subunit S [Anaerolineae bacterium]|nr:restriction endonuclease subunit S [Anaerolineae bacterium]
MSLWDLPSGWLWKPIADIAEDTARRNPTSTPVDPFQYVDISSVDNEKGAIKLDEVRTIEGKDAPSRARKVIHESDVIIATTRPYLRNIALIPQVLDDQICSTGFCVIRAKTGLADPRYLYFACRSQFFINQLIPKQRGANYPAVTDSNVYETQIPVPYSDEPERSLVEQQRIVARIEALLAEVREMRKLQVAITADVDPLMRSILAETFPNTPEDKKPGWEWVRLGDLGKNVGGGTPRKSEPAYWGGKIPWVSPKDMKIRVIEDAQDHVTEIGVEQSSTKLIPTKSILIVFRSGILAHSLPIAIAGRDLTINQDMKAIILDSGYVPDYVAYALQAREQHLVTTCVKKGPTVHSIVGDKFWQEKVPIPIGSNSLNRQQQIVSYLDKVQTEIEEMTALHAEDTKLIDAVEQAILAQAFRGEL